MTELQSFQDDARKINSIFFFTRRWYPLKCKPGQSKNDYRGDLEVRTAFTVKAVDKDSDKLGSTADLSSKNTRGSLISLNKVISTIHN